MSKANPVLNTVVILLILTGIVVAPLVLPAMWAWLFVAALMIVFMMILGSICTGHLLGILINEQNLMSLSRFQAALWTVIIMTSYLVAVIARVKHPGTEVGFNALDVTIPDELLALIGISATALVGTPLINTGKAKQEPGNDAIGKAASTLVTTDNEPKGLEDNAEKLADTIQSTRKGILYVNPTPCDACFWDLFEGDEIGNAPFMNLGKVQLFFVTVVTAVAYLYYLLPMLSHNAAGIAELPKLPMGLISLLGISNVGYLGSKAVTQTQTS